jgi:tetratricopeptide (TPR) repeat protein
MKSYSVICFFLLVGLMSKTGQANQNNDTMVQTADLTTLMTEAVKFGKDRKFDLAAQRFEALLSFWQVHCTASLYLRICRDLDTKIEGKKARDVFKGVYEDLTGNTRKGLEGIAKVAKKYPDYYPLYVLQAGLQATLGEDEKAQTLYDQAIATAPETPLPYLLRGRYYTSRQDPDRGIADYATAIKLDSASAIGFFERGFTYCLKKKYDLAIRDFESAAAYYPDWRKSTIINEAYHNRGLQRIERKAYRDAVHDFDQAIAINPDFLNSYLSRGIAFRNLRSYQPAMQDFNYCIEKNPNFTDAYYNRAITSYRRRLYEKAAADLQVAAGLVPGDERIQFKLAESYYRLGRYDEAVRHFGITIELNSQHYWAHYWRGFSYSGLGQAGKAIAAFQDFLKIVPKTYARQISSTKNEIRQLKN